MIAHRIARLVARLAARQEGLIEMTIQVPRESPAGPRVIAADVAWEDAALSAWAEVVIDVVPSGR